MSELITSIDSSLTIVKSRQHTLNTLLRLPKERDRKQNGLFSCALRFQITNFQLFNSSRFHISLRFSTLIITFDAKVAVHLPIYAQIYTHIHTHKPCPNHIFIPTQKRQITSIQQKRHTTFLRVFFFILSEEKYWERFII